VPIFNENYILFGKLSIQLLLDFTDIQKFISMRSMSVATFGWKASAASPSNLALSHPKQTNCKSEYQGRQNDSLP